MGKLFVYGTLAPGEINHHVMSGLSGEWEVATVNGTLIKEGWGADHGCPGLFPSSEAPEVSGYVFTSDDLDQSWDMLDEFEGDDYKRVLVTAKLSSGLLVESFVYSIRTVEQ